MVDQNEIVGRVDQTAFYKEEERECSVSGLSDDEVVGRHTSLAEPVAAYQS